MGSEVKEFEKRFSQYIGTKYGVAVNSGTSANMIALNVLLETGELKKGDEVIVPAATFASVVSPIIHLGLIPVYVDVNSTYYNIDPEEVKKAISKKTKAIIIVHSLGVAAEIDALLKISKKHNLKIIEDCCEAHGAKYKKKKVGSFGDLATFSFFVSHNMTTGEGGMVLTNNSKYDKIARSLREFGRYVGIKNRFSYYDKYLKNYDKKYIFERVGHNVRMTDLVASLGIEQLKKLDKMNATRREIAEYIKGEADLDPDRYNVYYGLMFISPDRLKITKHLEKYGIETRPFFAGCLPDQPAFRNSPKRIVGNLTTSRFARDHIFFIGCHPGITKQDQDYIIKVFEKYEN